MTTAASAKQLALVHQALALRAKYRVASTTTRVAPLHIGFHPANRGGEPPSAERCVNLLESILGQGFDPSEADCNGVLVQERPGSTATRDFNVRALEGNEKMAAVVDGTILSYGSLSHSHLNQVFKNILAQLPLGIERVSNGGKAQLSSVVDADPALAKYCKEGLLWDVLSYKIMDEEPEGLNVIQAACNCKHAVAMMPHEMEAIASLSKICKASSAVAGRVCFQKAKEKLMLTLPAMAHDPDFVHLFRFVVDLGGDSSPFIPDLRDFTGKFVNPQANSLCTQLIIGASD